MVIYGNSCLTKQHKINISLLLYRNHEYAFLREDVICLFISKVSMPIGAVPEMQKSKKINWLMTAAASPPPLFFTSAFFIHFFHPLLFPHSLIHSRSPTALFDGSFYCTVCGVWWCEAAATTHSIIYIPN